MILKIFISIFVIYLFLKKKKTKNDIIYHKLDAKNIILIKWSSKKELIDILAIKYNVPNKEVSFLYDGHIIIDNVILSEKWGRDGKDYKIYYPISETIYAENCGWEAPEYWDDIIISNWKESWNRAYKQYKQEILSSDNKKDKSNVKIIKGPWCF